MSHRDATQLRVGGYWLALEMPCSPPTVVTTWSVDGDPGPSGTFEISWEIDLPQGARHPALRRGALVEIVDAGVVLESGVLLRPTWRTGSMTAIGLARQAAGFAAQNASGAHGTSIANTAVDAMIDRATTHTTRPDGLRGTKIAESDDIDSLPYVADVLDAAARVEGKRWGVTPDGRWFFADDPTTPTWLLAPGVAEIEPAGDDYSPTVKVRYKSSDSAGALQIYTTTDADAERFFGPGEQVIDARDLGQISDAQAQQLGDSVRRKSAARLRLAGSIDVAAEQLTTIGGTPAALRAVRAGHMLRIPVGFSDFSDLTGSVWLDVVIGRTEHTYGATVIRLDPIDMAPRSPMQIAERLMRRIGKLKKREKKLLEK